MRSTAKASLRERKHGESVSAGRYLQSSVKERPGAFREALRERQSQLTQNSRFPRDRERGLRLGRDREEGLENFLGGRGWTQCLIEVDLEAEAGPRGLGLESERSQRRHCLAPAVGDGLAGARDLLCAVHA